MEETKEMIIFAVTKETNSNVFPVLMEEDEMIINIEDYDDLCYKANEYEKIKKSL